MNVSLTIRAALTAGVAAGAFVLRVVRFRRRARGLRQGRRSGHPRTDVDRRTRAARRKGRFTGSA